MGGWLLLVAAMGGWLLLVVVMGKVGFFSVCKVLVTLGL
jgi:hypothetical protein